MLELLRFTEENLGGQYIIDTSNAYRGSICYVSGVSSDGIFKLNLPKTAANAALCRGIVNYYPMVETGSDTAQAVDKLTKGQKAIYITGPCEIKIGPLASAEAGPFIATSFGQYFSAQILHTTAVYVATAFNKKCYVGYAATNYGKFVPSSLPAAGWSGTGTTQAATFYGERFKIKGLYGNKAGVTVWLDIDWNRNGNATSIPYK